MIEYQLNDPQILKDLNNNNHHMNLSKVERISLSDIADDDEFKPITTQNLPNKLLAFLLIIPFICIAYLASQQQYSKTELFYNQQSLSQVRQLQFCLLLFPSNKHSLQQLLSSIQMQNFSNLKTIQNISDSFGYFELKQAIENNCEEYSAIMFINYPLAAGALKFVNEKFQRNRAWVLYSETGQNIQIHAFLYRIYQLLQLNDFNNTNKAALTINNRPAQVQGMLQLCSQSKMIVPKNKITNQINWLSYFSQNVNEKIHDRESYTTILRLSIDYPVNNSQIQFLKHKRLYEKRFFGGENIRLIHMIKAFDRQQLIFLPKSHSIQQIENQQMQRKYSIQLYKKIENQVRFCVTVLSHNNIQNQRYSKVIRSIIQQEYDNYHIVFIDDLSDDQTMQKTIQYFEKMKFPKSRLQFVQNLQRNFASYNIINAAFNFCHEDDVQMLIDGDDQFIGKHALQVMNSAYQKKQDVWIAYSNYKTNLFIYGISRSYKSTLDHAKGKQRIPGTFIGPIRTWRVKLIRSIPSQHHRMKNGLWLDSCYDDSLAHPLVELAGFERTAYVPQIFYEYNTNYGDNDDATLARVNHRLQIYDHILTIPALDKLASLSDWKADKTLQEQLKSGKNIKYKLLQI